jgi:hypothetical protein
MDLQEQIKLEKDKLNSATDDYQKLQIVYTLIELKKRSQNPNVKNSIFADCKSFLKLSILSIDEPNHGYFNFNGEKIEKLISFLPIEEQLNSLRFFSRELKQNGFEQNIPWLTLMLKRKEIQHYWAKPSVRNFFKLIAVCSTYNLLTVIISLALIFALYSIVLLPAPNPSWNLFNSTFKEYSTNGIVNHLANSFLSISSLGDIGLEPNNLRGILVLAFIKFTLLLFILNFLLDELKSKLKF